MITTLLISLMLQGEPQKPQEQRDTTTTQRTDAPKKGVNIVIKLPGGLIIPILANN